MDRLRFLKIRVRQNNGSIKTLFATVTQATMDKVNEFMDDKAVQLVKIQSENGQTLYINKSDINHILEGDYDESMVGVTRINHQ